MPFKQQQKSYFLFHLPSGWSKRYPYTIFDRPGCMGPQFKVFWRTTYIFAVLMLGSYSTTWMVKDVHSLNHKRIRVLKNLNVMTLYPCKQHQKSFFFLYLSYLVCQRNALKQSLTDQAVLIWIRVCNIFNKVP